MVVFTRDGNPAQETMQTRHPRNAIAARHLVPAQAKWARPLSLHLNQFAFLAFSNVTFPSGFL